MQLRHEGTGQCAFVVLPFRTLQLLAKLCTPIAVVSCVNYLHTVTVLFGVSVAYPLHLRGGENSDVSMILIAAIAPVCSGGTWDLHVMFKSL